MARPRAPISSASWSTPSGCGTVSGCRVDLPSPTGPLLKSQTFREARAARSRRTSSSAGISQWNMYTALPTMTAPYGSIVSTSAAARRSTEKPAARSASAISVAISSVP